MGSQRSLFRRFAEATARYAGKPAAFMCASLLVIVWASTGPMFHFGDTWQLVINTGTTIITFLMVFLIQNTQNRDTAALQIKLDELICSSDAHNALLNLEELDDQRLERIRNHYIRLAEQARQDLAQFEERVEKRAAPKSRDPENAS
ncbi:MULTISPECIES: low affinity iron permease family protein [Dyella]|uniref:Low affinity iron permease family protein n=2 Tax=Dyella TaxID=231454 RepID=A0A4R0YNE0_9GAMM|nr:low affinity iron permease family protein [Dyella terrae]TCI07826.1 low affinity iron permease family protein [Dyella soli]